MFHPLPLKSMPLTQEENVALSITPPPSPPPHRLSLKPRVAGHACDIALNSIILNILNNFAFYSIISVLD